MSFGEQPLANALIAPEGASEHQLTYELAPTICSACGLFQLLEQPIATSIFTRKYPFFTSTSTYMSSHFSHLGRDLIENYPTLKDRGFVVEIGSNDGTLLQSFAKAGINHLGFEPSESVANVAKKNGINTNISFFNSETASLTRQKYGPADIILGANVIGHIAEINDIGSGVASLLKDDGIFLIEAVYLGDMLLNTAFDQLYDEHVFTFSGTAVANAFRRHGLELINVERQSVHGGSMRYTLAPLGSHACTSAVKTLLDEEEIRGLNNSATYVTFRQRCEAIPRDLPLLLNQISDMGHKIVAYGATAKSATVLNYCGLGTHDIAWIQDSTEAKQGMLTPRTLVPIVPPEHFRKISPEYAILFAWNHRDEIEIREREWRKKGGKWILYIPKVTVE